ncbi:FecR family protein [Lewinella sp. 4G2]|uniref:FecR family protein n=1 Tax=Lewinella sp. 4G2 TaxID=1803372 RepID=UPI0007B4E15A|nr:FecR domain-containing protein [Lewinella sp. 4G2]OAV45661.1 hypothetical protein A3850_014675 [Lewinella sp. 4G2]
MSSRSHEDIDQLAAAYGRDFQPDVEQGLRRLHATLNLDAAPKRKLRVVSRRWLSIAATFLLVAAAGLYFLLDQPTVFSNSTAAPLAYNLPDGSSVVLQSGAEISFDDEFAETERRVDLRGQGYFEIEKDATKPFLVSAGGTTLRVTGTAFNLRVTDGEMEVEVSEGSVELTDEEATVKIAAKQCGLAKAGAGPQMMPAPNLNRHAWRTGKLTFEDAPLNVVLATLSNNWDLDIEAPAACDYNISADYAEINVKDILDGVAKLGGLKCEADGEKAFRLTGSCGQ